MLELTALDLCLQFEKFRRSDQTTSGASSSLESPELVAYNHGLCASRSEDSCGILVQIFLQDVRKVNAALNILCYCFVLCGEPLVALKMYCFGTGGQ